MLITRKSPRTGETNSMDLNITQEQIDNYKSGTLLQDAFPNLSAEEREFWKTSYTPADWAAMFPPEEEEE